jgi:hypothetical protein
LDVRLSGAFRLLSFREAGKPEVQISNLKFEI